jgi:hypothetical protein
LPTPAADSLTQRRHAADHGEDTRLDHDERINLSA